MANKQTTAAEKTPEKAPAAKELKITLVKSTIGALQPHKRTVQALGLGKTNSCVVKKDNPATRGMIHQVRHLLKVEEVETTI